MNEFSADVTCKPRVLTYDSLEIEFLKELADNFKVNKIQCMKEGIKNLEAVEIYETGQLGQILVLPLFIYL
jgi:hypothetical protein